MRKIVRFQGFIPESVLFFNKNSWNIKKIGQNV